MKNSANKLESISSVHCSIVRYVRTREQSVRADGLEPLQYHFLALVEGGPSNGNQPNISALANQLSMHHHSAVELVDRLEQRGLLQRERGKQDRRHVFLKVTAQGKKLLRKVAQKERADVCQFAPELLKGLRNVLNGHRKGSASGTQAASASSAAISG